MTPFALHTLEQVDPLASGKRHDSLLPGSRHPGRLAHPTHFAWHLDDVHLRHVDAEHLFNGPLDLDLVGSLNDLEAVLADLVQHRVLFGDDRPDKDLMA